MSSNISCLDPSALPPFNNVPDLPRNVSVGFVSVGRNGSHEAMSSCCSPQAVNIASDCYYWCELSKGGLEGFGSCLMRHGMEKGIVGMHVSNAASPTTGRNLAGLLLWVLCVTSALRL
ncbi:uncharacterized protein CTRU02_207937 [Colletotrichum truncatum]|uniref:Uncharacterized protein n=1 Tax=Colletotrichum truncatum TaxID=5467 RepID=A0ACC3Z292_COLTU|nr:uncharacterized protein CTRU02_11039 [Colletotrichum truncatum]KAF6786541.1 hypothetical protein CTRU02_11039 [Colletotrichum truncatum]